MAMVLLLLEIDIAEAAVSAPEGSQNQRSTFKLTSALWDHVRFNV
jgi:hypothetical protein